PEPNHRNQDCNHAWQSNEGNERAEEHGLLSLCMVGTQGAKINRPDCVKVRLSGSFIFCQVKSRLIQPNFAKNHLFILIFIIIGCNETTIKRGKHILLLKQDIEPQKQRTEPSKLAVGFPE
ncbi:hypothetical protein, partial [Undibacterium sp.]|uniref:hypothetical protein n=1 Tax=Undibacterium sp. TaxID=1914977 RepID=UPI002CAA9412